eukprot:gnl/TRDRNA2_/TRDRNA2_149081_c0_seq1.p1 gnl/TRDRNA2_/TRDRNA2_149081_c0~~gnl/TRDRNA2_/TRDRNA2_149081_c0_seq1.p1  ORF type:complete len:254 (+),score=26.86 gnl/TRDRNA2_/TRDRNA2_149081_c0_seq1:69-764(+)
MFGGVRICRCNFWRAVLASLIVCPLLTNATRQQDLAPDNDNNMLATLPDGHLVQVKNAASVRHPPSPSHREDHKKLSNSSETPSILQKASTLKVAHREPNATNGEIDLVSTASKSRVDEAAKMLGITNGGECPATGPYAGHGCNVGCQCGPLNQCYTKWYLDNVEVNGDGFPKPGFEQKPVSLDIGVCEPSVPVLVILSALLCIGLFLCLTLVRFVVELKNPDPQDSNFGG